MKVEHKCVIEIPHKVPREIEVLRQQFRCDVCGQFWVLKYDRHSGYFRRVPASFPNVKLWIWKWKAKRVVRAT